jgi:hypothetical protein
MLDRISQWLRRRPRDGTSGDPSEYKRNVGISVETLPAEILDELERAKSFKWFSAVGEDIDAPDVERIRSWDDWEGPENERVAALHTDHSDIRETLIGGDARLDSMFVAVCGHMIGHVSAFAPCDLDEDAWHAPTTAVNQAGFTVALVVLHKYLHAEVPDFLAAQYNWYERGHWPCGCKTVDEYGGPAGLCIF